ncbi:MAG: hypothetical protein ABI587_08820 [Gemmatimonadales bacterium]
MALTPRNWKAAGLLTLAVLLGAAAGSLLGTRGAFGSHGHGRSHGPRSEEYVARVSHEVGLTAAQRDSVRAVLGRHHDEMKQILASVEPRLDSLKETIRAEVRTQLTPEQLIAYNKLTARLDAERKEDERQFKDEENRDGH